MRYGYAAAVVLILLGRGESSCGCGEGREQRAANAGVANGKPMKAAEEAILPPSRSIQLTLSDGRKVAVGQRQTLAEQGAWPFIPTAERSNINRIRARCAMQLPGEMAYNTLEVPRGNKARIVLPDGTEGLDQCCCRE
ncbi:hypothetical protein ACQ86N_17915 [Puia sp. P3]|uniref:hypothetical protein n=1 Tax=Puia sp. P3 TaxID=3423952 RepID=UPI003D6723B1